MKVRSIEFVNDDLNESIILFERLFEQLLIQYLLCYKETDLSAIGEILNQNYKEYGYE